MREEISEFLRSRRARISPEQAGLARGGSRRVAGLRREEVAVLAAISVDWYVRIERGNLSGVSDEVLDGLAAALQLDAAEREHLFHLADGARHASSRRASSSAPGARVRSVSPGLRAVLDSMHGVAAWVRNPRFDVLATNTLGRGLFDEVLTSPFGRGNTARFAFLDPSARVYYRDWEKTADDTVAVLRGSVGADPTDRALTNLIGELAAQSTEFSQRWAVRDVKYHRSGRKRMHHRIVGDLDMDFEGLSVPADPSLSVFVYHARDDATRERLQLLESWSATVDPDASAAAPVAPAEGLGVAEG